MKVRIEGCFIFDTAETGAYNAVIAVLKAHQAKMVNISDEEKSRIEIQNCYHDEVPVKECQVTYSWTKE
jgi:hypothetical protein